MFTIIIIYIISALIQGTTHIFLENGRNVPYTHDIKNICVFIITVLVPLINTIFALISLGAIFNTIMQGEASTLFYHEIDHIIDEIKEKKGYDYQPHRDRILKEYRKYVINKNTHFIEIPDLPSLGFHLIETVSIKNPVINCIMSEYYFIEVVVD